MLSTLLSLLFTSKTQRAGGAYFYFVLHNKSGSAPQHPLPKYNSFAVMRLMQVKMELDENETRIFKLLLAMVDVFSHSLICARTHAHV